MQNLNLKVEFKEKTLANFEIAIPIFDILIFDIPIFDAERQPFGEESVFKMLSVWKDPKPREVKQSLPS